MALDVDDPQVRRLGRAAEHLSRAGWIRYSEDAGASVLDLSIALELLVNDGQLRSEILRTIIHRVALLTAGSDEERLGVAGLVDNLYRASSAYRHGSDPPLDGYDERIVISKSREVEIPEGRQVIRQVALALLHLTREQSNARELLRDSAVAPGAAVVVETSAARARELAGGSFATLDEPVADQGLQWTFNDDVEEDDLVVVSPLCPTFPSPGAPPVWSTGNTSSDRPDNPNGDGK